MTRFGISVAVLSFSSPALAAGAEDMPGFALLWIAFLVAMPCVGLGFFLQGLMTLRNALILLAFGLLVIASYAVATYGSVSAVEFATLLAATLLLFAPLFGAGWFAGMWAAKRKINRQQLA